jgi:DNA-binding winged helix-turn-helix (wHTH) protein/Tfp pilus assembly protein PilF
VTVRFDRFEFDARRSRLLRDGRRLRVQPQPLRVLELLIAASGEVVSRGELRAALWPDGTHVEFEAGLNTAVRKLRRALGDSAASPRFVITVPGRGYRFVAPVEAGIASAAPVRAPGPGATTAPAFDPHDRPTAGTSFDASGRRTSRVPARLSRAVRFAAVLAVVLAAGSVPRRAALAESAFIDDACALHGARQPELALRTIERGLVLYPDSAVLRAHRGLYLHAVGRYDEEIAELRRAVAQAPRSAEVHYQLGMGLARRAQYDESLHALDRAVALSGGEPRYLSWLGRIAADAGRAADAHAVIDALRARSATIAVAPALIDAIEYHLAHARG